MTRNALLFLLAAIILTAIGCRLYARKSASDFGGVLASSFSFLSNDGFADTEGLREFLATPEIRKYPAAVKTFSILGGGYDTRMDEVQKGLIYLSEQMSLPQERRFSKIPALRHFKIEPEGASDRSVVDAAAKLILDYRQQIVTS